MKTILILNEINKLIYSFINYFCVVQIKQKLLMNANAN